MAANPTVGCRREVPDRNFFYARALPIPKRKKLKCDMLGTQLFFSWPILSSRSDVNKDVSFNIADIDRTRVSLQSNVKQSYWRLYAGVTWPGNSIGASRRSQATSSLLFYSRIYSASSRLTAHPYQTKRSHQDSHQASLFSRTGLTDSSAH